MKIAIDVHSIGSGAGGNETFYRQLVRGLLANPEDHRYFLFYTHPAVRGLVEYDERFAFIRLPHNPALRNAVALPGHLHKLRPDVFHCQYVKPPFVRYPTVVSIHDIAHEHLPEHFSRLYVARQRRMVRATARKAGHILTVSEFSAQDIAQTLGVPRERITVAYLAAAPEFQPMPPESAQREVMKRYGIKPPFLLYIGRLNSRKNLLRLVEAYATARRQSVAASLVLAGPRDWQSEQVLARIKELDLESSVTLPGYVEHGDLPRLLCASEAFVFPSLFEGFGLPVVEAMACGVPVLTSRGTALQEVAGDAALLVDPRDTASIAEGLAQLLADPALRAELARRSLQRSTHFRAGELPEKALASYRAAMDAAGSNW
jgi:glycosyltransferase involved in cell wall biosynthesis